MYGPGLSVKYIGMRYFILKTFNIFFSKGNKKMLLSVLDDRDCPFQLNFQAQETGRSKCQQLFIYLVSQFSFPWSCRVHTSRICHSQAGQLRVKTHFQLGTDFCLPGQSFINSFCTLLFFHSGLSK